MFKPGDRYVHFTKYGGINFGEVKWFSYITRIDGRLGIHYKVPYISTLKNFHLSLDGSDGNVYKISHDMTPEELERWTKLGETMYNKEYTANKFAAVKNKIIENKNDNNIS